MRLLMFLPALALAACSSIAIETPEQIVLSAGKVEIVANKAVTEYKMLPRCGGMVMVPLCSTQANADLADKVLDAAATTIDAAELTVRDPRFAGDTATKAAVAAQNAAAAALEIITQLRK
jgi:hypothetical protein